MRPFKQLLSLALACLMLFGLLVPMTAAEHDCPSKDFSDVPPEGHWAHAGIDFMIENGYMAGTSTTEKIFSPTKTTNRAMMVQILYRMSGSPPVSGEMKFQDVREKDWFHDAVLWAVQTDVTSGVSDTAFNPKGEVTREQIAVFLHRYAKVSEEADGEVLKPFPDVDKVSSWAVPGLSWAVKNGIIAGKGRNGVAYLDPKGKATRQEVATMYYRFISMITKPTEPEPTPTEPELNKSDLEAAVEAAEKLNLDEYTPESVNALQEALSAAKQALDEAKTQEELDTAKDQLAAAVAALEQKPAEPELDKAALEQAIEEAEQVNRDEYTEESAAALDTALNAAKKALDEAKTQEELDAAAQALKDALAALVEKPVEPPVSGLADIDFTTKEDAYKYEIEKQSQSAVAEGTGLALICTRPAFEDCKGQNTGSDAVTPEDVVMIPVSGDWTASLEVAFDQNGASNGYYQFFGFYAAMGDDFQNLAGIRGGNGAMQNFIREDGTITHQDEEGVNSEPGFNTSGKTYFLQIEKSGTTYLCSRSDDGENYTEMFTYEDTGIEADYLVIDAYTGMTTGYKFTLKYLDFEGGAPVDPETLDKTALEAAIADAEAVDRALYTDQSLSALDAALTVGKKALTNAKTQRAIDKAAQAIIDAIAALEVKPEACEHDYVSDHHPATCTKAGYTVYTCRICGKVYRAADTGMPEVKIEEKCPSKYSGNQAGVTYGEVQKITYYSTTANRNKQANVRLPLNYDPNQTYPVLYLLHGVMGSENDMVESGKIFQNLTADGLAENMFIVCPNMFSSPTMSAPNGINQATMEGYDKFVDDLKNDLMPYMKEHYPIKEGKENTAVCGFSMGGRESLTVSLFEPDLFGYIGAFSPAPGVVPGKDMYMTHPGTFKEDEIKYEEGHAPYLLMICCGDRDSVVGTFPKSYHELYDKNGIDHYWWEIAGSDHGDPATSSGIYNFGKYVFQGGSAGPLGHDYVDGVCTRCGRREDEPNWVSTWATAEENFTASSDRVPNSLNGTTVRQIIRVTTSGSLLKLKFSNEYGDRDVVVHSLHVAKQVQADKSTIDVSTDTVVTVGGAEEFVIPKGQTIETDPFAFEINALENLAVSMYFGNAPTTAATITGHRGARATTYQVSGNKVADQTINASKTILSWYFLCECSMEMPEGSRAVVCFGDSITDGYGTDADYLGKKPDSYTRWGDYFARRLQADESTKNVAVLNEGIGANSMFGGSGPAGKDRYARDLLEHNGVEYVIILFGVNDLNKLGNTSMFDRLKPEYEKMIKLAHDNDIKVYLAPILPFGTSDYYSASSEQVRTMLNDWFRSPDSGADGIIDFESAVADPANPKNILEKYTHSDGLHPYDGYDVMADAIDLELFKY